MSFQLKFNFNWKLEEENWKFGERGRGGREEGWNDWNRLTDFRMFGAR